MAISGSKPWVNPCEKIAIFRLFEILLFIAQKGVFSFQNIKKHIFLAYIAKKKLEKWPFLDQNHGLTPLEKSSIFRLFELLFFKAQKSVFFRSRILYKTFSWPILPKTKNFGKRPFLDQNHGLTPLEKCQFFGFLNSLFLQPRKAFLRSKIS